MARPLDLAHEPVSLSADGWRGELDPGIDRDRFVKVDLPALLDPDRAAEVLYWGSRNLLYRQPLVSAGGIDVAVKLSRNQGWFRRQQRRVAGSKAQRAWRMARAFDHADVPAPKPLAWLDSERADGPSLFITAFEPGLIEVRYVLRSIQQGAVAEDFPWLDPIELWRACGKAIAAMHAAGLWHRDTSIGNLVVRRESQPLEVLFVDLNRARGPRKLSRSQRLRDLCRLPLESEHEQSALLSGYLGRDPSTRFRSGYHFYKDAYFGRITAKRWFRSLLPQRRHKRQHPYEHIPRPQSEVGTRGQATWDHLTEQPFQHASPSTRKASRLRDAPAHVGDAGRLFAALPSIALRSRALRKDEFAHPVPWPGIGVAVSSAAAEPEETRRLVDELDPAHVLLRVYPWEEPSTGGGLARELAAAGYDLTFALPQNRELVTDPDRWRSAVRAWGRELAPWGSRFQIGQAINRSKWGVWTGREYATLVDIARQELPATAQLIGPAVIDFEPLPLATVLTRTDIEPFDVTSALLYVDRRGAPENQQMGFDTVAKARLMRAIGAVSRAGSDRLWVTEVNWPLPEGPHSPAGRKVAVDEEAQADYAVRYYVMLLASGMVERVYWWQLIARGYGLVDREADGGLRRRPAFGALATLGRQLATSTFERRVRSGPGNWLLQFSSPSGESLIVGWSADGEAQVTLPRPVEARFTRDGEAVVQKDAAEVTLTESPNYFWLQPDE